MRALLRSLVLVLSALAPALAGEASPAGEPPLGWTASVRRLAGSERELWHLALVFHRDAKEVTLVVAPTREAGREADGIDAERVERSPTGDLHQIALWAERLRRDAEGWKRPSLRDRPEPSAHVIGVVRAVAGQTGVENAEHGGGELAVGDLLLVEDVLRVAPEGGVLAIELLGGEGRDDQRVQEAALVFGAGAKAGLVSAKDGPAVHVHAGCVRGTTYATGLCLHTGGARAPGAAQTAHVPGDDTTFLLQHGASRLGVREGAMSVSRASPGWTVLAGGSLALAADGRATLAPLDERWWEEVSPREPACSREGALRLVAGVQGYWRGQHRKASLTLGDDGRWRSYAYDGGRSSHRNGAWEPRPGGLVELTWVWTPHRSRTARTDVFRYLLRGDGLSRLEPGGQVFLRPE